MKKFFNTNSTNSNTNNDSFTSNRELLWKGLVTDATKKNDPQKVRAAWKHISKHIPPIDADQYIARVNYEKQLLAKQQQQQQQHTIHPNPTVLPTSQEAPSFSLPEKKYHNQQLPNSGRIWAASIKSIQSPETETETETETGNTHTEFESALIQKWLSSREYALSFEPPRKKHREFTLKKALQIVKSQTPTLQLFASFSQVQIRVLVEVLDSLLSKPTSKPSESPFSMGLAKWMWFILVFLDEMLLPSTQATLEDIQSSLKKMILSCPRNDIPPAMTILTILNNWNLCTSSATETETETESKLT